MCNTKYSLMDWRTLIRQHKTPQKSAGPTAGIS